MEDESIFALANQQGLGQARVVESVVDRDVDSPRRRAGGVPDKPTAYYRTAPHQDSSQISSIFNPVRGVRDQMRREGRKPRNHARDNVMAIRNQSQANRLHKQMETEVSPTKSKAHIKARSSNYGRAPTPSQQRPSSKDFIRQNKSALAGMKSKKLDKKNAETFLEKENFGKLPRYLIQRKLQLAEDYERRRELEREALAPPGTRLMPEDERLQTLEMLEQNKEEVERHLKSLPFVVETPSQIKAKTNLEKRLQEIEDAQRLFSRRMVFVKI